ncbi:MAG: T9SS type A sorting domain-containing protein [Bacteroidales bacterium]|nr:T9SS type A sorting domain-containing protein [Bacteroidales bacterium]
MRKFVLFTLLMAFSLSVMADDEWPIAVDDTVYVNLGETYTVYPLVNDTAFGDNELIIASVSASNSVTILSSSDTSITFKLIDYAIGYDWYFGISYYLEPFNPFGIGRIIIIPEEPSDILFTNNIKATIYPQNLQFYDLYFNNWPASLGYFFPADAKTSPLFNYGLWIGGKDADDNLHLAAERYKQQGNDFWSGPLSDDGLVTTDSLNSGNWLRSWKVDRSEILSHIANYLDTAYQMPEAIESWPAHGDPNRNQAEFLAPFVDIDGDLEYHPELGDYPFIKGDQTIFFIYNDQLQHTESGGEALGVEIHCMAWAVNDVKNTNAYNSTMFFSYKFFNRSNETYYDTYIGTFADFDIGYARDDYVGCHVDNGNFFGYNGDDFDETIPSEIDTTWGYGDNIPTQSICILGGPFLDDDGRDNPLGECNESINGAGFGDGIIDNEMYGMNRFVYFANGNSAYMSDPNVAPDYYNYMRGLWKDSTSLLYGGNGHASTGGTIPARFIFPGESDACNWGTDGIATDPWTEETAGNEPGDRRGVASMGPFTFEAGSVHYLDIAMVTAPGDAGKNSKDLVQDYIAQIKQDYLVNPSDFGNQYVGLNDEINKQEQLLVYPNPIDGDIIRFKLPNAQATEYFIYNAAGQIIKQGILPAQKKQSLNISLLDSGWYILEVKTDGQVLRSKLIK